jgi:hypothetical protein
MSSPTAINSATVGRRVHWSRVLHIADGLLDDNIYGEPRLRCIWNRLDDLEKVAGGGSEAFWKRADQGLQLDIDPTLDVGAEAQEAVRKQIHEYEHGLRRMLLTRGLEAKTLGSDVADFASPVGAIMSLISAGTGIPQRVLMGSEQAKLAAKMDRSNWDDRVADRRDSFAGPYVVRQAINRFIALGVLPAPVDDYDVRWSQLKVLDDEQRAEVAMQWAGLNQAAGETVVTGAEIREHVLGLGPLEEVTGENPNDLTEPVAAASRKGAPAWKHVHQAADRFRTARATYHQIRVWRRAQGRATGGTQEGTRGQGRKGGTVPRGQGGDRHRA